MYRVDIYQSTKNFMLTSKMCNFISLFLIFRELWHFEGQIWGRTCKSDKFDLQNAINDNIFKIMIEVMHFWNEHKILRQKLAGGLS